MSEQDLLDEIKVYLDTILKNENLSKFSVDIAGKANRGDGFLSDIVFVTVDGTTKEDASKTYNLALKLSKKDPTWRVSYLSKETFGSEIYIYETVLSEYKKFQIEQGILEPFNGVPKYYGKLLEDNFEIIALEDMRHRGFKICDKAKPLSRQHVNLVLREYAKFHATGAALQAQRPEVFDKLAKNHVSAMEKFIQNLDLEVMFGSKIRLACDLLKNELDEKILAKWGKFADNLKNEFSEMFNDPGPLKVFLHGDSWNNNFMFQNDDLDGVTPKQCVFLDIQLSSILSPVLDVSYFLFACLSEEDAKNIDNILDFYYEVFSWYMRKLKTNPNTIYSRKQFFEDWKKKGRFAFPMVSLVMQVCSTEQEDVVNDDAAKGDIQNSLGYDLKSTTVFKERMKYIMKNAVEFGLL